MERNTTVTNFGAGSSQPAGPSYFTTTAAAAAEVSDRLSTGVEFLTVGVFIISLQGPRVDTAAVISGTFLGTNYRGYSQLSVW